VPMEEEEEEEEEEGVLCICFTKDPSEITN
jgi:hypothetical protein